MNFINKKQEPPRFANWRLRHPHKNFKDLPTKIKKVLHNALLEEQGYVCCFCGAALGKCDPVSKIIQAPLAKGDRHNVRAAHIVPQSVNNSLSMDYNNICASCDSSTDGEEHCDIAQKAQCLPISPLESDCLSFFSFDMLGHIFPDTNKDNNNQLLAKDTINILGLDCRPLALKRQKALGILLRAIEANPHMLENGYLEKLLEKDTEGKFTEFYFVLYKYIQDALKSNADPGAEES